MQMSRWTNVGSGLNDDDFFCSHILLRPTSEYFPELICLWFGTDNTCNSQYFFWFALFYLLVCCFIDSSLVIWCVTSACQLCLRLFEIQNSVLMISSSDSFVMSTYQMISNARWLIEIYSQLLRFMLRLGSCDANASFENSFCLYLRVWVLCLRMRVTDSKCLRRCGEAHLPLSSMSSFQSPFSTQVL